MIRAAPKTSVAVTRAGPVNQNAQPSRTDPAAAAMTGCTAAMARPAATATPTMRRMMLGRGTSGRHAEKDVAPVRGLECARVLPADRGDRVFDEGLAPAVLDLLQPRRAVPPARAQTHELLGRLPPHGFFDRFDADRGETCLPPHAPQPHRVDDHRS